MQAENPEPQPDALDPMVLRTEVVNIIRGLGTSNMINLPAAERKADKVIETIMRYYERVATPEVNAEAPITFNALSELQVRADRIINAGASMSTQLAEQDPLRRKWINEVGPFREAVNNVLGLLS